MAEILNATFCRRVALEEALTVGDDFCRVLQSAGGQLVAHRALLWPTDLRQFTEADGSSVNPFVAPEVDIHFVRDVLVGGYAASLIKDGRYIYNSSCFPVYMEYYIQNENSKDFWVVEQRDEIVIEEPVRIISHFNPIYGHWLLEIFPKLFSVAYLSERGIKAPILLPKAMPAYVRDTIDIVLPGHPVLEYDHTTQNVRARRVILPGMMHRDYVFNGAGVSAIRSFGRRFGRETGLLNLFVSRSGLSGRFREASNVDALDEAAMRLGLTVIRPECIPWTEQVGMFASARLVVGEYGSGIHNTIFSPPGARVVCLNIMNNVQRRIADSFEQDLGYILDPDGTPRVFELGWQKSSSYEIDIAEFESRVGPLVS